MRPVDPRDLSRLRTAARLLELGLKGLLLELPIEGGTSADRNERMAVQTAREFAERCQIALEMALRAKNRPVGG